MRTYGGATGEKIAVWYEDSVYMLKCSQSLKRRDLRNVEVSYANDCISEYIGSRVYEAIGIPVHNTIIGDYHGKQCVLCKDVAYPDVIVEFRQLRNTLIDSGLIQPSSGMSTNLSDIFMVMDTAKDIDLNDTKRRFWEMFVVDSIIGNCDRNNGNWGYLKGSNSYVLAPVYDCGGCLNNKKSDNQISSMTPDVMDNIAINYVFNFTYNDKRINPFKYMEVDINNTHINNAMDMMLSIDRVKIWDIIDDVCSIISEQRASFYKYIMNKRLDRLSDIFISKPKTDIMQYSDATQKFVDAASKMQ